MLQRAAAVRCPGAARIRSCRGLAFQHAGSRNRRAAGVCRAAERQQDAQSGGGIAYPVVSALAAAGAVETAYLTLVKYFDTPLVCPTNGCEAILNSEYSTLFGVPLSLLGMLTYAGVAGVAALAFLHTKGSNSNPLVEDDTSASSSLSLGQLDNVLLCGATLLGTTSAALIYVLLTEFPYETCAWCYLSAGLSLSLVATVAAGMGLNRLRAAAAPGAGALVTSLAILYLGFVNGSNASNPTELPYSPAPVTSKSSQQAVDLALRLRESGAKMYGAFWCSHCSEQKQTFGREAMATFPYVECFPQGWKRGLPVEKVCSDAGVRAFPTWVINGRNVEGELTLDALQAEVDTPVGQPSPNMVFDEEDFWQE